MSENNDYLGTGNNPRFRLMADGLALMLKGAGYAAIVCLLLVLAVMAMVWIGKLLPEESRDRPDPTPFSFYLTDDTITQV